MIEGRTPEREVGGSPPPSCVLEQDTFLPKVLTGTTQEAVASPRLDYKLLTGTLNRNAAITLKTTVGKYDFLYFNGR